MGLRITLIRVGRVIASGPRPIQDHMVVIPPRTAAPDWLDACCWGCGTDDVALEPDDDRVLCRSCRDELAREPAIDVTGLAQHAYWQSHALGCCWRCMIRAVDPDDEVGMCAGCREEIAEAVEEGGGLSRPFSLGPSSR